MVEAFGEAVRRLRAARGDVSLRQLARLSRVDPGHLSRIEAGLRPPTRQIAASLDQALGAGGALVALAATARPGAAAGRVAPIADDDEMDAYEMARRVEASDVGAVVLDGIGTAADQLAIAYHGTHPADLLPEVRRYLGYAGQLLDKRMTLAQRAQLLTAAGWLSLLAATLHIDLRRPRAAAARLATAHSLAEHVGHPEIAAWCLETRAWEALTEGRYRTTVELAQAAQQIAPKGGSAVIQATAQEGRAWAKLGDHTATRDALTRVERFVSPMATPDQPEHHYRYDPDKQLAYTATTLAWVGDPAAAEFAGEVVEHFDPHGDGGDRPRRAAAARLDLARALLSTGRPDEAAGRTLQAIESGRIVPSNVWRVAEIVTGVEAAGIGAASELRDAYESLKATASR